MNNGTAAGGDLAALVESYELEIDCRHCDWSGQRCLSWLDTHRDMNCPMCGGVIVLNTSELRYQITALRRQVAALHGQLAGLISWAEGVMSGAHSAPRIAYETPASKLGLCRSYGNRMRPSFGDRRMTRTRR